jgi:hypothetical protein
VSLVPLAAGVLLAFGLGVFQRRAAPPAVSGDSDAVLWSPPMTAPTSAATPSAAPDAVAAARPADLATLDQGRTAADAGTEAQPPADPSPAVQPRARDEEGDV